MTRRLLPILAVLASTTFASAEDWPQFRGPNCSGVSTESRNLPVTFSHTEKVKWSAELGDGVSCPVISDGRLFVTGMTGKEQFAVFGFDAATGKELWKQEFNTGPIPAAHPQNIAASTPATDGERVYVHFSTLGLLGFDATNGQLLWKHSIPIGQYLLTWGSANSPIVYEDLVIFGRDDDLAAVLLAVDKHTGDLRWKTERPEMLGGYAVPVICTAGGRTDVVVAGSGKMKGYDPRTGAELWSCNSLLRTVMTTPVVKDDHVYITVQSYGDTDRVLKYALLQWKDTNQDGKLEKTEVGESFEAKFDFGDKDKDGFLVDEEIDAAFQSPANMAGGGNIIQKIRGGGKGDVTKTHLEWNLDHKAPSNMASPLLYDGRLFVVKKGGISAAFDEKTGETVWMKKRIRNFGDYYASPVAGDGKIYVTGENGTIVVLAKGPKPKILATNDMGGESCVATPAIADNRLYVRTNKKIYCISEEAQ